MKTHINGHYRYEIDHLSSSEQQLSYHASFLLLKHNSKTVRNIRIESQFLIFVCEDVYIDHEHAIKYDG